MNLAKKKTLAVKTLNVGKGRIVFVKSRLDDIKEALTKQDIRELHMDGAIIIKDIKGKKKKKEKPKKRGVGKVKKKVNVRKQNYVIMTRKLRKYTTEMFNQGKISKEDAVEIRKRIRNKKFRSKSHLKEYIGGLGK